MRISKIFYKIELYLCRGENEFEEPILPIQAKRPDAKRRKQTISEKEFLVDTQSNDFFVAHIKFTKRTTRANLTRDDIQTIRNSNPKKYFQCSGK